MSLVYLNPTKRLRAIDTLKKEAIARGEKGFVPTEEQILERYNIYGGATKDVENVPTPVSLEDRIKNLEDKIFGVATLDVAPVESAESLPETVEEVKKEEKPKRRKVE